MKKLNYISYILIILLVTGACSKDELNTLTVSQQKVNINANGGTANITVQTDADAWSITNSAPDWLSTSATTGSGGQTTVTLTVNSRTLQTRTATLMFTAGNAKSVEVVVTQASATHLYITTTDPTTITFSKTGGTLPLKNTTDATQWSLSEDADWLEFAQTTGNTGSTTINATASANWSTAHYNGTGKRRRCCRCADHRNTKRFSVSKLQYIASRSGCYRYEQ